jgi:hypothetical protein
MSEEDWSEEDSQSDHEFSEHVTEITRRNSYEVVDSKTIAKKQAEATEAVSDQLGLTRSQALSLLSRYSWNPELVCQKVMDGR